MQQILLFEYVEGYQWHLFATSLAHTSEPACLNEPHQHSSTFEYLLSSEDLLVVQVGKGPTYSDLYYQVNE